jgi:threonine dehydratase
MQIPGEPFHYNKLIAEGYAVSDLHVIAAIQALADQLKIDAEPHGAAALAAALLCSEKWSGKTVVAAVSSRCLAEVT